MTRRMLAGGIVLAAALAAVGAPTATRAVPPPQAATATDITAADLQNAASGCGLERWAIKVASDAQRNLVSTAQHATTIAALRSLPRPARLPSTRIRPTETSEYVVAGTLLRYKLEGDGDLHLVLADSAGRSLIVEIADPRCAPTSRFQAEISTVRHQFLTRFTPTSSFKSTHTPMRVRGVGFFDYLHGQSGVAPNGIELHPVLGLGFSTASPTATQPPTSPTPSAIPSPRPSPSPTVPTGSPSPTDTASPAPTASPSDTASPSPSPTSTSVCGTTQPCITSISDPARHGSTATASVAGATPNSTCTLSVTLPSGSQSQSAGLGQTATDSNGAASWSWTIGSNTNPGTANAHVTCPNGTTGRSFQIT